MTASGTRPTKIVYLSKVLWGVAWYRCHTPGVALKELGHDVMLTDNVDLRWPEEADIFVTLALPFPQVLDTVRRVNARGGLTVLDVDDDYWNVHPENPAAEVWTHQKQTLLAEIAREVQLITATTPEMAAVMRPMNSNVAILPNMLPDQHWIGRSAASNPDTAGVVLGWAGSGGHRPDVRMVSPFLTELLNEFDDLEIELAGAKPDWILPHARIHMPEFVRIEDYPTRLSRFDIGIAPLLENQFNRLKSDLKFLEYGILGIPAVYSKSPSYERSVKHGKSGFLAAKRKDWLRHLRALIRDADLRAEIGGEARKFAETRLISDNIHLWEEAYGLK